MIRAGKAYFHLITTVTGIACSASEIGTDRSCRNIIEGYAGIAIRGSDVAMSMTKRDFFIIFRYGYKVMLNK